MVIVNEGLKQGDRIIIEGTHKVREGMPVTVAPAQSPVSKSPEPTKD
jgi:multidrug efflux pump subunit AcrA (membrane-fusion protein)